MSDLSQDHINDLRAHSIATWPRVYLACGIAFVLTFVSTGILGNAPAWGAVTAIGVLFSVVATLYALAAIGLTTYFESSARNNYANSLFSRSSFPLNVLIMKEALKPHAKSSSE